MRGVKWTEEELEILEKMWGMYSLQSISKKINRSKVAIQNKAIKCFGKKAESSGRLSASELARALGVEAKTITRFKKMGLPTKKVDIYHMIKVEDFWKFAKENKDIINFTKFEKNTIPDEPTWVDEERRKQSKYKKKYKKWTDKEDRILINHVRNGKTNREISKIMDRTFEAVAARRKILNVKFILELEKNSKNC